MIISGRQIIEDKLLASLHEEDKVAVVLNEEDLEMFIQVLSEYTKISSGKKPFHPHTFQELFQESIWIRKI